MKTVHILIGGRVQGVGFRFFALSKAKELNISGWVRNTSDSRVEIEAEGQDENLEIFTEWLRIGPTRAVVKSFQCHEIFPHRNFSDFLVR